ncbi:hypothetical protein H7I93_05360 [Mycobacterium nebraskense]|uniref:hypothetical protein n=1 Tax=Mycobacterium nebraskense TaxID=244292 RepID=UPI0021F273A5|nr:hypothetical protein [Mycobacterium nebraskense]MCV7116696.1 hypothetical protein [Mycobacterium nebraskense]
MDTVLGVSIAHSTVRMVLIEGESADGVTVDEDNFELSANDDAAPSAGADRVISAILGTREGAAVASQERCKSGLT